MHYQRLVLFIGVVLGLQFSLGFAQLPLDEITTETLSEPNPHWVWAVDVNFVGLTASKALLVDGDSLEVMGIVSSGLTPNLEVSPEGDEVYLAELYYTHGTRGERIDLLTIYDGETLSIKKEIEIPPHASIVSKRPVMGLEPSGRFLAIFNMRPATSVTIIDTEAAAMVGETETPGCFLVIPVAERQFAMMCGDGSIQTLILDEEGGVSDKVRSEEPLFDVSDDPVFEHTTMIGDKLYLIHYSGQITEVSFDEGLASVSNTWNLAEGAEGWLPGGWQLISSHGSMIYALMGERPIDTHKYPSENIWVLDVETGEIVQKIELEEPAISLHVTPDDSPLLFALSDTAVLQSFDALSGEHKGTVESIGVTPYLLIGYQ